MIQQNKWLKPSGRGAFNGCSILPALAEIPIEPGRFPFAAEAKRRLIRGVPM